MKNKSRKTKSKPEAKFQASVAAIASLLKKVSIETSGESGPDELQKQKKAVLSELPGVITTAFDVVATPTKEDIALLSYSSASLCSMMKLNMARKEMSQQATAERFAIIDDVNKKTQTYLMFKAKGMSAGKDLIDLITLNM